MVSSTLSTAFSNRSRRRRSFLPNMLFFNGNFLWKLRVPFWGVCIQYSCSNIGSCTGFVLCDLMSVCAVLSLKYVLRFSCSYVLACAMNKMRIYESMCIFKSSWQLACSRSCRRFMNVKKNHQKIKLKL